MRKSTSNEPFIRPDEAVRPAQTARDVLREQFRENWGNRQVVREHPVDPRRGVTLTMHSIYVAHFDMEMARQVLDELEAEERAEREKAVCP